LTHAENSLSVGPIFDRDAESPKCYPQSLPEPVG
jgi:hypothetical protein